jgi:Stage II sporulation protein E (SpoIIE)
LNYAETRAIRHILTGSPSLALFEEKVLNLLRIDLFPRDAECRAFAHTNPKHQVEQEGNPPLLLHRDGTIDQLSPTGPPLAASTYTKLKTANRRLSAGDRLILFSDGLPEAINPKGEFFSEERIERVVREYAEAPARDIVGGIIGSMVEFEDGATRNDDVACVSLVYRGRNTG